MFVRIPTYSISVNIIPDAQRPSPLLPQLTLLSSPRRPQLQPPSRSHRPAAVQPPPAMSTVPDCPGWNAAPPGAKSTSARGIIISFTLNTFIIGCGAPSSTFIDIIPTHETVPAAIRDAFSLSRDGAKEEK